MSAPSNANDLNMYQVWRAMTDADLDGVVAVARIAFPDHFEDRDCFAERLTLYPTGCRVLTNAAGAVVGYGIAYPWVESSMPPLNATIGALPRDASLLYLHDLALMPEARGSGAARGFVGWLVDHARAEGRSRIALVAVNDAAPFWEGQGFAGLDSPALRGKLASYGDDARYMVRALPPSDILDQPSV
ncbi:GNAT family N-acetyltransferase [Sphingomonas sp. AX6]|nr:GNAT family N-acetyltransferase [Sphingomonas sp. AX6]